MVSEGVLPEFAIIHTSSAVNNMIISGSELGYWPLHGSLLFYFLVMCVLFKQSRQISEVKKNDKNVSSKKTDNICFELQHIQSTASNSA